MTEQPKIDFEPCAEHTSTRPTSSSTLDNRLVNLTNIHLSKCMPAHKAHTCPCTHNNEHTPLNFFLMHRNQNNQQKQLKYMTMTRAHYCVCVCISVHGSRRLFFGLLSCCKHTSFYLLPLFARFVVLSFFFRCE